MKLLKKISFLKYLVFILIIVSIITSVSYALFYAKLHIDNTVIESDNLALKTETKKVSGSEILSNIGSKYSTNLTVSALGDTVNKGFYYDISFSTNISNDKEKVLQAILIFVDGEYVGTLSNLITTPYHIKSPLAVYKNGSDYVRQSRTHNIELELHIGAGQLFSGVELEISLTTKARQITPSDVTFVSSEKDLIQIAKGTTSAPNIVLINDITLTNAISLPNYYNIDVNGYTLNTNNFTFVMDSDKPTVNNIFNSGLKGGIVGGKITLNSKSAIMKNMLVTDILIVAENIAFNKDLVYEEFIQNLKILFKEEIKSQADINIIKQLSHYIKENNITMSYLDNAVLNYNYPNITVTPTDNSVTYNVKFGLDWGNDKREAVIAIEILGGTDEAIADAIFQESMAILEPRTVEGKTEYILNSDIFLPSRARLWDANLQWITDSPDILDADGSYNRVFLKDIKLKLSCIISYQGKNFVRTATLAAVPLSPEEIVKKITIENRMTFAAIGEEKSIPTSDEYKNYGVTSISYNLDFDDNKYSSIFRIVGEKLQLYKDTDITEAKLQVVVTIDGYSNNFVGYIEIEISILRTKNIFDDIYLHIKNNLELNPSFTLKTFNLPAFFSDKNSLIRYDIVDESGNLLDLEYINVLPEIIGIPYTYYKNDPNTKFINNIDYYTVKIDTLKLPQDNTTIYLKASVQYKDTETQFKIFNFGVLGVLHNSPEDIEDLNLFLALCKLYNQDMFREYIIRDDIDNSNAETLDVKSNGINSLKGINFFSRLKNIDLSNNNITDIKELANFVNMTKLNLSKNVNLVDISTIRYNVNLTYLNLSGNSKLFSLEKLSFLRSLEELYLNDCFPRVDDLSFLSAMVKLKVLHTYNTNISTDGGVYNKNLNYIINAYSKALTFYQNSYLLDYQLKTKNTRVSFDTEELEGNRLLNNISTIYEINNVINLPFDIKDTKGNNVAVVWTEDGSQILDINNTNKTAYVTQPIENIDVFVIASIQYGTKQLYRRFKIYSNKGDQVPKIEQTPGQLADADDFITDAQLRYEMFRVLDKDSDNIITQVEINGWTTSFLFNLDGKGIKDITGIEYFSSLKLVTLFNSNLNSLEPLASIAGLQEIYLNSGSYQLSEIKGLNQLSKLYLVGVENVRSSDNLKALFTIYENNKNIKIYLDSATTEWNPYKEAIEKAVYSNDQLKLVVYLPYRGSVTMPTQITGIMVADSKSISVKLTYNNSTAIVVNRNVLNYPADKMYVTDAYESLTVTAQYADRDIIVNAEITVVLTAPDDYFVDISTDNTPNYQPLFSAIPSPDLRRAVLANLASIVDKKITKTQVEGIKNITFSCTGDTGLSGIKIFRNLELLTISEYYPTATADNNLSVLTAVNFPKLKTLKMSASYVDVAEIQGIPLATLEITASTTVKISDDLGINTAFSSQLQGSLNTLRLIDCNLYSFGGLEGLKNITTLYIYNNPACANITENNAILLKLLGTKPSVLYQLFMGINWSLNTSLEEVAMGGVTLKPNFWENNYIDASNNAVTFEVPVMINGYDTSWTFLNNTMSVAKNTNGDKYIITAKNLTETNFAYNVATLEIKAIAKKQIYTFVIKGSGSPSAYFDLETFLSADKENLNDPTFTYKVLTSFEEDGVANGIYIESELAKLKSLDLTVQFNVNSSTKTHNITGLRYFTSMTSLSLRYQILKDVSEIRFLTALTSLSIVETAVETMMYNSTSILADLKNLSSLTLVNNNIKDYSFLNTANHATLATLEINCYNNTSNRDNMMTAITEWAASRNNLGTLKLMNITYTGATAISALVKQMASLSELYTTSSTGSLNNVYFDGSVLRIRNGWGIITSTTTLNSTEIALKWQVYNSSTTSTPYGLKIESNNTMKFTSTVVSSYDHEMTLAVGFLLSDNKTVFYKTITAFYTVSDTSKEGRIEVTEKEKEYYKSHYGLEEILFSGNTIEAKYLIPDGNLKTEIFAAYNKADDILSLAERATSNPSFSVTKHADISNISGIELLSATQAIVFEGTNIESIPKLILPKASSYSLTSISFVGNKMLNNISNLDFRFNGECYTLNELIKEKLSFRSCSKIMVDANKTLSNSPAKEIDMYNTSMANYAFSKDIYKTNTKLIVNLAPNQENAITNFDYFQELIMQSYNPYNTNYSDFSNNFNPNILAGYLLPQTEYNIHLNESDDQLNNRLPNSFRRYGKKYYAVYDTTTTLENDFYQIKEDVNGYYIVFRDGISAFPTLTVKIRYIEDDNGVRDDTKIFIPSADIDSNKFVRGQYQDVISISVKDGQATQKPSSLYKKSDIKIWQTDADGNNILLSAIMPDVVLRILVLENFVDDNKNDIMDEAEAAAIRRIVTSSKYEYINVLEGIGILSNLEELSLIRCNALDLSPLSGMKNLKKLKLSNSQDNIVIDLSPLSSVSTLEEINLAFNVHGDISFIMSLPNLKFVSYIDNIGNGNLTYDQAPSKYTGFMDMALAYNRVYYRFDEYSENIETSQNGQYLSTSDQKKAAIILGEAFKGLELVNNNQLDISKTLPTTVNNLGKDYNITYLSLSTYLTFNGNIPTINATINPNFNKYRNKLGFLAVINLNGMCYTRYLCYGV